jgi:multiple sugar transport system permease protein
MALIGIWQVLGFNMVLFLAGLTAIPQDLYEAARLDGARSPVDRFLTVTWPMLGPTTMFVVVTTSITALKVFDTVAVLTKGRAGSETVLYALYLEGFEYANTGYAAALTLIFLAFVLILSIGQTLHLDRKVHY